MSNKDLAMHGLFSAIILIFGLTPQLGFIQIGPVAITLIPFIILIASFLFGFKMAVWLSFLFGWTSLFVAYSRATGPEAIAFQDPRVSVLTRCCWGVVVGVVVFLINKYIKKNYQLTVLIAAPLLNIVHASIVLCTWNLLYPFSQFNVVLSLIIATNSLVETGIAILTIKIVMPLKKVVK